MENTLPKTLQALRSSSGLKLKEVAAKTGIDQALLSKFESGGRLPTADQVRSLATVYRCDLHFLKKIYLAEKVVALLAGEQDALEVLALAEPRIEILSSMRAADAIDIPEDIAVLVTRVDALKKQWQKVKHVKGIRKQKMEEYFSIQYTYESNRIEGNTLTHGETMLVIKEGITISGKSVNEHLEAINHQEAITLLAELVQKKIAYTPYVLSQLHGLILRGIDRKNAGVCRSVEVSITGSAHVPPQPWHVPKLMEDYFHFYAQNEKQLHPVILAAEMHERLVSIHPFVDGNGRTARLVMNLILLSHGYPIAILKGDPDSRQRYYKALEMAQTEDKPGDFYRLVLEVLISSMLEHITLASDSRT
ncbi:MAG: Fic family protein [Saprospiraceae bacterium]|nr:Fic family protein [Saprospiraceae bacterium]